MSPNYQTLKWKIYNFPQIGAIEYCSILDRKRTFCQLMNTYESNVTEHDQDHYCCISKDVHFQKGKKLLILFPNKSDVTFLLGLKVHIRKDNLMANCNELLIFLKKAKMDISYISYNDNIYIHCEPAVAWELFYGFFEYFLQKPVTSIVGTQFYYSSACQILIRNELIFLNFFKKKSKIVKINKDLNTHGKRKIVSDLISCVDSSKKHRISRTVSENKSQPLSSNIFNVHNLNIGFCTASGRKISISDSALGKVTKQFSSFLSCEIPFSSDIGSTEVPKKLLEEKCTMFSLQDVSFIKCDREMKHQSVETTCSERKLEENQPKVSNLFGKKTFSALEPNSNFSTKSTCEDRKWNMFSNFNHCVLNNYTNFAKIHRVEAEDLKLLSETHFKSVFVLSHSDQTHTQDKIVVSWKVIANKVPLTVKSLFTAPSTDIKMCMSSDETNPSQKNFSEQETLIWDYEKLNDNQVSYNKNAESTGVTRTNFENVCPSINQLPLATEYGEYFLNPDNHLQKKNEDQFSSHNHSKSNISVSNKIKHSGFQTASGKNLNISKSAILVAETMYKEVCGDCNDLSVYSNSDDIKENTVLRMSSVTETSCNSKSLAVNVDCDESMDEYLAEKFFSEVSFDEKVTQVISKPNLFSGSSQPINTEVDSNNCAVKVKRKSLGCRRILKHHSNK